MTHARNDIIGRLWRGRDPFAGFPSALYAQDREGWRSDHHYLTELVEELQPRTIVEIGVWKGASVITMAAKMRELGQDGVVIAVDTWLGSAEVWMSDERFATLPTTFGQPALQITFTGNILAAGLADYVVPLPLDSLNAAIVLRHFGIRVDAIHLDAAHDFLSVKSDLAVWWPLLREGGVLIGDDYAPKWKGVVRAFDEFAAEEEIALVADAGKCRIVKPMAG